MDVYTLQEQNARLKEILVTDPSVTIVHLSLKEGQEIGKHHGGPARVTVIPVKGEVIFSTGDHSEKLVPGKFVRLNASEEHGLKANQNSEIIMIKQPDTAADRTCQQHQTTTGRTIPGYCGAILPVVCLHIIMSTEKRQQHDGMIHQRIFRCIDKGDCPLPALSGNTLQQWLFLLIMCKFIPILLLKPFEFARLMAEPATQFRARCQVFKPAHQPGTFF